MTERNSSAATRGPGPYVRSDADTDNLIAQTAKLAQLNSWFEIALNNMARGLSMFDAESRLIVCNAVYREIYELPEELARPGTHISQLMAYHVAHEGRRNTAEEQQRQRHWIERHAAELARGKTFTHTQHLKGGRIILVTNQPLADGGWVDIQEDVTEKTRATERITWLAQHCPLTETANRFQIRELLIKEIRKLKDGTLIAVHLIDLDRFKEVNDTHGHATGDALLKAVAKRMRSTVRDLDLIGRLGGDEFVIVQPGITHVSQAETLAQRLLKNLDTPYRLLGNTANIGASIGIALEGDPNADIDGMLRRADVALYRVKSAGRGHFKFYREEDERAAVEHMEIEKDLRFALSENQLELFYQPIIDVDSRAVAGCEALMRWRHPRLGLITPDTFIPVAERSDLIVDMGAWAIAKACADAASWSRPIKVTVNLSALQLEHEGLPQIIAGALDASGLPAHRLELEVTESAILRNETKTKTILQDLRKLGVRIALDDFGTAFASLTYLHNFEFDKIKIDRSFISQMSERRGCLAIVAAVAGLATALEIGSVAEGVETIDQLDKVKAAGCNEVQGFHFSEPVPFENLEDALRQCDARLAGEQ